MPSGAPARSDAGAVRAAPAVAVALAGLALTLVALTFDATPLLVPGIGFAVLGAAAPAWVALAARDADVSRTLGTRLALEGEPLRATLTVRRGRLGAPGATVRDPLTGASIDIGDRLSVWRGAATVELRVTGRFDRRGRHWFAPPTIELSDTLGLARSERRGTGPGHEVLVLPRTEPVRWLGRAGGARVAGHGSPDNHEPMSAGEIDGLRQYMPGTPAARIHWPALARGAGLLERRLVDEPDVEPLIVVDARAPESPEGREQVDAAVRAAASLTLELARRRGCSLLVPGARAALLVGPDLTGWRVAHQKLAVVEPAPEGSRPPLLPAGTGRGSVIWVAASAKASAPLAVDAGGGGVLVVPAGSPEQPTMTPSFRVAGCVGYAIGTRARRRRVPAR